MHIDFVSIFPNLIAHWFTEGVVGRAIDAGIISVDYHSPRKYSDDRHGRIDDRPFGGGAGMVMQYLPLARLYHHLNQSAQHNNEPIFHVFLSPQGTPFHQGLAKALAQKPRLALWCGRYEGVDQRFIDAHIDLEISLGDFVLSGGEIAASVVADAVCRLVPNVLGDAQSAEADSFQHNLLDYPHYTRPQNIGIIAPPEILLSGNHAHIARWRLKQALGRTFILRPDLFDKFRLNDEQIQLLNEYLAEYPPINGEP